MSQIEANDGKIEVIFVQKQLFGKSRDGLKVCAILALVTQSNSVSTSQRWKHLRLACEAFFLGSIRVHRRDVIRFSGAARQHWRAGTRTNATQFSSRSRHLSEFFCANGKDGANQTMSQP
jgi:hypothetical protein